MRQDIGGRAEPQRRWRSAWINPFFSTWSDRLRTRFGRRRAFLLIATALFAVSPCAIAIMASLININMFAFGVALGAVTVELFPREKIGQFCSARAFFYQTIIMVLNPLVISPFFDWLKFNRAGYLWSAFCYLLAGLITLKVYHNWKRLMAVRGMLPAPV